MSLSRRVREKIVIVALANIVFEENKSSETLLMGKLKVDLDGRLDRTGAALLFGALRLTVSTHFGRYFHGPLAGNGSLPARSFSMSVLAPRLTPWSTRSSYCCSRGCVALCRFVSSWPNVYLVRSALHRSPIFLAAKRSKTAVQ